MDSSNDLFGRQPLPSKSKKRATDSLLRPDINQDKISQIGVLHTNAKFKANAVIQYDYLVREVPMPSNPNRNANLIGQNGNQAIYNGYLSYNTKRRIEEFLSTWLNSIEQNIDLKTKKRQVDNLTIFITFVTLTLPCPQLHSDNTIKKIALSPFIEWLTTSGDIIRINGKFKGQQKGFGVQAYFWRAESQKNGRIHFHLIVDRYIPWDRIRDKWNQLCERLGYVTNYSLLQKNLYKNGFIVDESRLKKDTELLKEKACKILISKKIPELINPLFKQYLEIAINNKTTLSHAMIKQIAEDIQLQAYEKALSKDFKDPNSTDIHAIQNLDSVAAYVVKYVCKMPEEVPLMKNQKKVFNEELKRECLITYREETNPDSGEVVQVEIKDEFYTPKFLYRKINGRIWGSSDIFKEYKPSEGQVVETDDIGRKFIVERNEDTNEVHKTPIPNFKHYTKKLCEKEVFSTYDPVKRTSNYFQSPPQKENLEVQFCLDTLIGLCGEARVNELSSKVGEYFVKNNGKIIPIAFDKVVSTKKANGKKPKLKLIDVLEQFSPAICAEYKAYHIHTFNCLYNPQNN